MSNQNLDAIFSLKFYRQQKKWRLSRDNREDNVELNSDRAFDQIYTKHVKHVNNEPNSMNQPEDYKKNQQKDQQHEVSGSMEPKESTNLKSSINSQNDLTLGQIEGKEKDLQNPDVCIEDAQYSLIDETEAKITPKLPQKESKVIIRSKLEASYCPGAKPRVKPVSVRLEEFRVAVEQDEAATRQNLDYAATPSTSSSSYPAQYYPPEEALYQSDQEQPVEPQALVFQTIDESNASKVVGDLHNPRINSLEWYEKRGKRFIAGYLHNVVQDTGSYCLPPQNRMDSSWCSSVDSDTFIAGADSVAHSTMIDPKENSPEATEEHPYGLRNFEVFRMSPNVSNTDEFPSYFEPVRKLDQNPKQGCSICLKPFRPMLPFLKPPFWTRPSVCNHTSRPSIPSDRFYDVVLAGSHESGDNCIIG